MARVDVQTSNGDGCSLNMISQTVCRMLLRLILFLSSSSSVDMQNLSNYVFYAMKEVDILDNDAS